MNIQGLGAASPAAQAQQANGLSLPTNRGGSAVANNMQQIVDVLSTVLSQLVNNTNNNQNQGSATGDQQPAGFGGGFGGGVDNNAVDTGLGVAAISDGETVQVGEDLITG